MSAGAQPNSNQRATKSASGRGPPVLKNELLVSYAAVESPEGGGRQEFGVTANGVEGGVGGLEKNTVGAVCVVCGDRACSHLYYGVAACHGCKCFFWRTVKSGLTYVCRYGGSCSISTARRNACRFCRFNRCLNAGMKLEAVRMDTKKGEHNNNHNNNNNHSSNANNNNTGKKRPHSDIDSDLENQENIESPDVKRVRTDNRLLIGSLLLFEKVSAAGNVKSATKIYSGITLAQIMEEPELLDGERTAMYYDGGRVPADTAACRESERRLVTCALDWCRQTADMEDALSVHDKIALLRACSAPLTLLELGVKSLETGFNGIVLPNGTCLHVDSVLPQDCFLNAKIMSSLHHWMMQSLKPLALTQKEVVLLKAMLVMNPDAAGLPRAAEMAANAMRDRVTAALFQHCSERADQLKAAARMAKILLLLPQLMLMGAELVEHERMRHTFLRYSDPLIYQLHGDIFDEAANDDQHLIHSSSCSPSEVVYTESS